MADRSRRLVLGKYSLSGNCELGLATFRQHRAAYINYQIAARLGFNSRSFVVFIDQKDNIELIYKSKGLFNTICLSCGQE